jgi:hypothetical protein
MARCASDSCGRWRPDLLAGVSGFAIDTRWFCSHACVEHMVQQLLAGAVPEDQPIVTSAPHLRLGVLLRHHGALSADQLHEALEQQQKSGLRLGAQARAMFGIDPALVLKALAAQAGTRYLTAIDPATVHDGPGGLPHQAMAALGLIPFSKPDRDGRVRVASMAPVRWDAVNALTTLAGWRPEPYLVEDEVWADLFTHYGNGQASSPDTSRVVIVKSEGEAATRIATLAAASRRARLVEAHWDPYIWVRVHGEAMVNDVLFARPTTQELSWQAASTSH